MSKKSKLNKPDFTKLNVAVDKVGVEERVSRFQKRSIKKESKLQGLKMALNMIDLTTLEGYSCKGEADVLQSTTLA